MARHPSERGGDRRGQFSEDQAGWNPEGADRQAAERGARGKHDDSGFGRRPGDYADRDADRGGAAMPVSREQAFGGRDGEESHARRGRGSYDPDYYYPRDDRERRMRDHDYYAAGGNGERNMTFDRANGEVTAWLDGRDALERRQAGTSAAQRPSYRGRGPKNYIRTDDRIREDINERLSDDPDIDASDIEVTVSGGEATLDGTVKERFAKRHAEDIAESVNGINHVQNNLRVKP